MPEQLALQTSTLYFKIFYTSTFIMKDERVTNGRRSMYSNIFSQIITDSKISSAFTILLLFCATMYRCVKQKRNSF